METREFLEGLIRRAGNKLLENFKKDSELIKMRGSVKEVVTEFDKTVDDFIRKEIESVFPEHNLMTEEGTLDKKSEWTWIVDSLDGTSGFASGNPMFCVCIALMKKDELVMGSIYCPALDEFYFAEKDKGAYLNGERISVSDTSELDKSYVFSCEGGEKDRNKSLSLIKLLYPEVKDFRKLGSAGIEAAWVALGRGDAYVTNSIEPWDVAPGVLIVQEAGGKVTNFKGEAWKPINDDLIFSNGLIHQEILEKVKDWD